LALTLYQQLGHNQDLNDNGLRLESPDFPTKPSTGFVAWNYIYIRQQARPIDDTTIGRAVAVQPLRATGLYRSRRRPSGDPPF